MDLFERCIRILTVVLLGVLCFTLFTIAEEITLTTYYPAPYGAYNDLRATKLGIGTNYSDTSSVTISGDNLIVEGNVGIGTTAPTEELDVVGTVNATGYSADGSQGVASSTMDVREVTGSNGYRIVVTDGIITSITAI